MVSFITGGSVLVPFALGCLPMVVAATVVVVMAAFKSSSRFGCVYESCSVLWVVVTVVGLLVVVVVVCSHHTFLPRLQPDPRQKDHF